MFVTLCVVPYFRGSIPAVADPRCCMTANHVGKGRKRANAIGGDLPELYKYSRASRFLD